MQESQPTEKIDRTFLAKHIGSNYLAVSKSLSRGKTEEQIVLGDYRRKKKKYLSMHKEKNKRGRKSKPIFVAGTKYFGIRDAWEKLCPEISLNTVRQRLKYGWTLDESFGVVKRSRCRQKHLTA